jgi:hypothetical protein
LVNLREWNFVSAEKVFSFDASESKEIRHYKQGEVVVAVPLQRECFEYRTAGRAKKAEMEFGVSLMSSIATCKVVQISRFKALDAAVKPVPF